MRTVGCWRPGQLTVAFWASCAGFGCATDRQDEIAKLSAQVRSLQDTIAQLRLTPTARLAAAREAQAAGRETEAERGYQALISQFATSPEAREARASLHHLERLAAERAAQARAKAAEEATERARRERALLTGITKRHDDMQGNTWYRPVGTSGFGIPVHLYMGERGGSVWLRLWIGTATGDWLFWERVIFNIDGSLETYEVGRADKETDVVYGGVREWMDVPLDPVWEATFRRMAKAATVKVRFEGKYRKDITLTKAMKDKLQLILDLYDHKKVN